LVGSARCSHLGASLGTRRRRRERVKPLARIPQRRLVEEIGRGVCDPHLRETECVRAGRGFDDVPDRELVANDQRDRLRPPQQTPQGVGVAADGVVEALSVRKALAAPVLVLPSPVGADRLAVEATRTDLVEVWLDEERNVPSVQRELNSFPRAEETGRDREVDVEVGELLAESTGLFGSARCEADRPGGVAA
jgi:hypothetical protein